MIAEVYPLRRMPRTFSHLDYFVPEGMDIQKGSFVQIPFRQNQIFGIVKRVKDKPPRGITLKPIVSVLVELTLQEKELSFFEDIATQIAQSVSSLLHASLPQPPKKKSSVVSSLVAGIPLTIPAQESETVARLAKQMHERRFSFLTIPDLRRTAAVIARYLYQRPDQKATIICPTVRDVTLLCRYLHQLSPLYVTGEETNQERFETWKNYRQSKKIVLITTRTGLFYPDATTTTVFLVRSNHANHIQHDRNPRLDAHVVTKLFAECFTTNLFYIDVAATLEDLLQFGKDQFLFFPIRTPVQFIDAAKERPVSSQSAITTTTCERIAEVIEAKGRVLVVYNKKGYAIRLRCMQCDHRFVCSSCKHLVRVHATTIQCVHCGLTEPSPQRCPSCKSPNVQQRGYGSERLYELFHGWFPNTTIQLVDAQHPAFDPSTTLTLATQYFLENYFDPFNEHQFDCVVHLDPDSPLFATNFRATQRAIHGLYEWIGVAHANQAPTIVQTEEGGLFEDFLQNPIVQLEEEYAIRSTYAQPPFTQWIRVTIREAERKKRELEVYLLTASLEKFEGVRVSPQTTSVADEHALIVRTPLVMLQAVLPFFSTLDDHYIIDVNAFS